MWEKASETVYDMLVGHEVGHALYTPDEDWTKKCKAPPQFVNVVEDVRIEKLMKRRYMGLSKSFYKGYKELSEKDFFCLEGEDMDKMNLADRINLHFKIGNFVDIGSNTTIDRGAIKNTIIQDGVKIDNQVQIGHNCVISKNTIIAGCVGIAGSTVIGEGCRIGGAAMILGHLNIARESTISPGTMIASSINKNGKTYTGFFPFFEKSDWIKVTMFLKRLLRKRV